jgi:hypothetical protein
VANSIDRYAYIKAFEKYSNAKVTTSNHLSHYRSKITKNDYKPWKAKGLVTRNSQMKYMYLSPSKCYSKDIAKV